MQIGSMTVDPLIDGELLSSPTGAYLGLEKEEWDQHHHFLHGDRLLITMGGYLVRDGSRVVLVDAGVGPRPVFPLSGGGLRSSLLAINVHPDEITDVIFSHLHFDHTGWATLDGTPFFRNATYRCDRRDWDHYVTPDYDIPDFEAAYIDVSRDSALNRLGPLAYRMEFFEGDDEILPGFVAYDAAGHTPGSSVLRLTSQGESGLLLGDLVHSEPELFEENWDFIRHHDHAAALASIERFRAMIQDENLPFAAAHFPGLHWGRLEKAKGRIRYRKIT